MHVLRHRKVLGLLGRCSIVGSGSSGGRQGHWEQAVLAIYLRACLLQEPSTCNYLLTVATPRLCKHPDFRIQAGPVGYIVCRATPAGTCQAGVCWVTVDWHSGRLAWRSLCKARPKHTAACVLTAACLAELLVHTQQSLPCLTRRLVCR